MKHKKIISTKSVSKIQLQEAESKAVTDKTLKHSNSPSIRKQLKFVVGLLLSFLIILVVGATILMLQMKDIYEELLSYKSNTTEQLQDIKINSSNLTANMAVLVNDRFARNTQKQETDINSILTSMDALIQDYIAYTTDETSDPYDINNSNESQITALAESFSKLNSTKESIFTCINTNELVNIEGTFIQYELIQKDFNEILDELIDTSNSNVSEAVYEIDKKLQTIFNFLWIMASILLIIALLLSFRTVRTILRKINSLRIFSASLSQGDLSQRISFPLKDELGLLADDLSKAASNIELMLKNIISTSVTMNTVVATCTGEIEKLNCSIQETAAVSEELYAQFESTAASSSVINELSETIHEDIHTVSEKAIESGTLADTMVDKLHAMLSDTKQSQTDMRQTLTSLGKSLQQSLAQAKSVEQIQILSSSILDITQQTNLLSLNASIEATRAGDAGRGFSVVANEIRALADTSKQTVEKIQEVTSLVLSSVNGLVQSSHEMLNFIKTNVQTDYSNIVASIEESSLEIEQIDEAASLLKELAVHASTSTDEISQGIQSVADSTNEGAHATETVSSNVNEITSSVDNILQQILLAKESSLKLQEACQCFTISKN